MESQGTILMKRYELGRLLGRGTYAKVYYAKSLVTGQSVAIKILEKKCLVTAQKKERITKEISAMRLVQHPNVLRLFEVMADMEKIYLVLEYAKGGELFDKIAKGKLQEYVARRYFQQLINAVDYCHSRGVYHRDLKPENLLLDDKENLKVSDFGLSFVTDSTNRHDLLQTKCGTPSYEAPEVIKGRRYDGAKADIWSCGVILFVLLTGYHPFQDDNLLKMIQKIKESDYTCPDWLPLEVSNLIQRMLHPDPSCRIPIARIRGNRWFRRESIEQKLIEEGGIEELVLTGTFEPSYSSGSGTFKQKQDTAKAKQINAFEVISFSAGLDLSNLLDNGSRSKEVWFTANKPAPDIITQLDSMAKRLKLRVEEEKGGALRLEKLKKGRKGVVAVDVEIFKAASSFHLVKIKKSNGDTLEYQKLLEKQMRPALKDIVWTWLDDHQQQ